MDQGIGYAICAVIGFGAGGFSVYEYYHKQVKKQLEVLYADARQEVSKYKAEAEDRIEKAAEKGVQAAQAAVDKV